MSNSESSLSRWATFFLVLGVFIGAGGDASVGWGAAGMGLASMVSGFLAAAVLRGLSDIVRLLKKGAGVPYEGAL